MPMGAMPILDIDGKRYHQSVAMTRYLAREVGLNGDSSLEDMEIDIVVDTIKDFLLSEFITIIINHSYLYLLSRNQ